MLLLASFHVCKVSDNRFGKILQPPHLHFHLRQVFRLANIVVTFRLDAKLDINFDVVVVVWRVGFVWCSLREADLVRIVIVRCKCKLSGVGLKCDRRDQRSAHVSIRTQTGRNANCRPEIEKCCWIAQRRGRETERSQCPRAKLGAMFLTYVLLVIDTVIFRVCNLMYRTIRLLRVVCW